MGKLPTPLTLLTPFIPTPCPITVPSCHTFPPMPYIQVLQSHCHRLLPIELNTGLAQRYWEGRLGDNDRKRLEFDSPSRRKTLHPGVFVATNLHSTSEWGLVVSFLDLYLPQLFSPV
jgi:hypothetical protein